MCPSDALASAKTSVVHCSAKGPPFNLHIVYSTQIVSNGDLQSNQSYVLQVLEGHFKRYI